MPGSADAIQETIHALESGGAAVWMRRALAVALVAGLSLFYLLHEFRGLATSQSRLARVGFLALVFVLCSWPMISSLFLSGPQPTVRWPPYVPPYIAVLNDWMKPEEITATEMPLAVAWYADRRALWLPETVRAYTKLSDYKTLGGPINAIYLTSISGGGNTLRDILRGEYKDWAPLIMRGVDLQKFPLKFATLLGFGNEAVLLSDVERQKKSPERK